MLLELILALLIGVSAGTITGLTPGIHTNLLGAILVSSFSTIFFPIDSVYLVVLISSMAITHTFVDFIPSIFLGCPDTDTELSILPGHKLLKKGQGYQATLLTAYGSLAAIIILTIISYPSILLLNLVKEVIPILIPGLLIFASLFIISTEQHRKKAFIVFALSSLLGITTLLLIPEKAMNQPLLPLLTGLFGASTLVISIKNKIKIPKQKIKKPKIKFFKPLLGALIASPICSFLPGLGSGQAAVIGNTLTKNKTKGFLFLLGATNTLVMGFSFISLYVISKTRTGAALAIKEIIGVPSNKILILILITTLLTGIISFFITISLTKFISKKINKISYTKISLLILSTLLLVVFLVSKFLGIIILIISTLTGIYCISLKVKRTLMMGCLMLPTIIYYLS